MEERSLSQNDTPLGTFVSVYSRLNARHFLYQIYYIARGIAAAAAAGVYTHIVISNEKKIIYVLDKQSR